MRHSDDTDTDPDDRRPKWNTTSPQLSNVGFSPGALTTRTPLTVCGANRTLRPPSE